MGENEKRHVCVLHSILHETVKEMKVKQENRPCDTQSVEITHLKISDAAQWEQINRLNRTIWFAGGAAFMGSVIAQIVFQLIKR